MLGCLLKEDSMSWNINHLHERRTEVAGMLVHANEVVVEYVQVARKRVDVARYH